MTSVETILNQLKAEVLLSGSWILDETKRFSEELMYKDGEELVSYKTYFEYLIAEVENLNSIQLQPVVPSGTSRAYLIDLTMGLEKVMDQIEIALNRVLFFQSKVKSANSAIKNLRDTFKAWYLIGIQSELQRFEIKLTNKALEALSDSEFTRLIKDTGSDLEALDMALSLLADRLKYRKKLAMEKYNLGKDQANASMIPMLGSQAGHLEGRTGMELLKEKYGLGNRGSLVMDDPPENLVVRKPVPVEQLTPADAAEATHDYSELEPRIATAQDMRKGISSDVIQDLGDIDTQIFNLGDDEGELEDHIPMGEAPEDETFFAADIKPLRGRTELLGAIDDATHFEAVVADVSEKFAPLLARLQDDPPPVHIPTTELRPDALGVFSDTPALPGADKFSELYTSKTKKRKQLFGDDEEETTTNVQIPVSEPKVIPATSEEIPQSEPIKRRRIIFDE